MSLGLIRNACADVGGVIPSCVRFVPIDLQQLDLEHHFAAGALDLFDATRWPAPGARVCRAS